MSNLINFNFENHQVRTAIKDGNDPYFCLADVAEILDIQNNRQSRFNLDEKGVEKVAIQTKGGKQEATFINEPNLYRVIFRSNKAEAVKFQNWVFDEVLPSIRKTGTYTAPTQADTLTDKDWSNLRRLVWLCENNFRMQRSAGNAIWARLRTVTGVKSPDKFSPCHLPILAAELERIFKMSELYNRATQAIEAHVIRNVLKYADDEVLPFFLEEMHQKALDYQSIKDERLPAFFKQDYRNLIERI